jgi:hypothetical protein
MSDEEKARELADMIGSIVVEESLPIKILKLTAKTLEADYEQILQAAEDIDREQRAIRKER